MGKTLTLCVDDEPSVLNAIRTFLKKQLDSDHIVEIAENGEEALEVCEDLIKSGQEIAVVISDYIMPGMHGDELLVRIHEMSPKTITILLTGQGFIDGIKRAINEANLYRFLEKPFNNDDILLTVRSAHHVWHQERELAQYVENLRDLNLNLEAQVEQRTRQLEEKNQELERIAITDRLTGVYNRLKLDQLLEKEFAFSQRYELGFSLLMLDADKFKTVNDNYGHQVGDSVLVDISKILREGIRATDAVGRWGGEEFLVICPNTQIEGALALAENLRSKVFAHTFEVVGQKSISIGVATYRKEDTIITMMERADRALYQAKENGRNRVEFIA